MAGGVGLEREVKGEWKSNDTREAAIVLKWGGRKEGMSHGKAKVYFHSENDLINPFENPGSILNLSTFLLEMQ